MKKCLLLIMPMLLSAVLAAAETCLTVVPVSGSERLYAIEKIGHISFSGNVMYLYDKSGNELGNTPLDGVAKIVFGEGTDAPETSVSDLKGSVTVSVYPNPTAESLVISGLAAPQTIRVYSLDGMLLQQHNADSGENVISVSNLSQGTYLLQVGAEVVKFIKQ